MMNVPPRATLAHAVGELRVLFPRESAGRLYHGFGGRLHSSPASPISSHGRVESCACEFLVVDE